VRVILKELENKPLSAAILETEASVVGNNIRSCLLVIEGEGAEDFGRLWAGSIQWVWQSTYRPHHKRKNWFVAVSMMSVPVDNSGAFALKDVRYETARAGGPGGQNVNKTETMVRAVHIPTGKSAVCRSERSQLMNKKLALARLAALFQDEADAQKQNLEKDLRHKHYEVERGNPIRVYDGETLRLIRDFSSHSHNGGISA
jgi:peptide chain release factor